MSFIYFWHLILYVYGRQKPEAWKTESCVPVAYVPYAERKRKFPNIFLPVDHERDPRTLRTVHPSEVGGELITSGGGSVGRRLLLAVLLVRLGRARLGEGAPAPPARVGPLASVRTPVAPAKERGERPGYCAK